MDHHRERLLSRLRRMETESAEEPWIVPPAAAVGSLLTIGFSADSRLLLTVSNSGRALMDARTGHRVFRDRSEKMDNRILDGGLSVRGIGPVERAVIQLAGIWGGGLSTVTADGWSVRIVAPDWPDERLILQPPAADVLSADRSSGCVQLDQPLSEIRASDFSPDGGVLALATASDLVLWSRSIPDPIDESVR